MILKSKKESTIEHAPIKKKFKIRYIGLSFLSLVLVCAIGISLYTWKLLSQPIHIDVPIVADGEISEGTLDSLPDINDDEDIVVPDDSTASSSTASSPTAPSSTALTSSDTGGKSYVPTTWGSGRVKLYVDSRFPITYVAQKDPNIENILIIGIDARSASQTQSQTDSIIVVTIDKNTQSIKLTSFMRDTEVKIPGRTAPTKINAAYVYGGIGLLINTMNLNFDLDIQKFAMVDMYGAEKVIDAAGGVMINITNDEIKITNSYLSETNQLFKSFSAPAPNITTPGLQLLNGRQAVAYGRNRYVGNDQARTLRQRTVLTALIVSFKASPINEKMKTFEAALQSFETGISKSDMLFLAFDVLSGMKNIQQYRVPENGMYTTNLANYNMIVNFQKQNPVLHQFIWGTN